MYERRSFQGIRFKESIGPQGDEKRKEAEQEAHTYHSEREGRRCDKPAAGWWPTMSQ